ncbi:twin-arginine translocase TatA/TatE family subunit [Candidatus Zixiibacteriota bacterium]
MFSLGPWEIILIVLALVILFGAKRLPELARGLGRSSVEFRKGLKDGGDKEKAAEEAKPDEKEESPDEKKE